MADSSSLAALVANLVALVMSWFGFDVRPPQPVADVVAAEEVDPAAAEEAEARQRELTYLGEVRRTAPFRESRSIAIEPSQGMILGFCPLADGRLVAITGEKVVYGVVRPGAPARSVPDRLVWLDAWGKEERAVELGFKPRAVTAGPDGSIWVVGGASVARFGADGSPLVSAEAPHAVLSPEAHEELAEEIRARQAAELEAAAARIARTKAIVADLERKQEGERGYNPRVAKVLARSVATLEAQLTTRRQLTDEQLVNESIDEFRQIHRIAVTADHVFLVTNQDTGRGFVVWRCTPDLTEPVRIVDGLAGCCGQMDIQVAGTALVIAENSRHRVRLVDFDGAAVSSFGKTSRDDLTAGFSGCCNPMNTCCTADGDLLTAESHGLVKRYSTSGEYRGVVGVSSIGFGCKNAAIGLAPDGDTLYCLDADKGTIVVLERR